MTHLFNVFIYFTSFAECNHRHNEQDVVFFSLIKFHSNVILFSNSSFPPFLKVNYTIRNVKNMFVYILICMLNEHIICSPLYYIFTVPMLHLLHVWVNKDDVLFF